jgi:hypothetical protein
VKFEDEKGHDDGEYAVAERLSSGFAYFKGVVSNATGISPRSFRPPGLHRAAARTMVHFFDHPAQHGIHVL